MAPDETAGEAQEAAPAAAAPVGQEAQVPPRKATSAREVVALPDRRKFHRPECRFAAARGAERMSRATARRRGYEACAICKP